MSDRDVLIRALTAGGHEQAAKIADAILPASPPTTGSADTPAALAASAAAEHNQAPLAQQAAGGQSDRERYGSLSAEQLADLPEDQFKAAVRALKSGPVR